MFKSKTVTKFEHIYKLFEWEINDLSYLNCATQSETMTATGLDGIEYTGVFNYSPGPRARPRQTFDIVINPTPQRIDCFFEADDGATKKGKNIPLDAIKVKLWVNVVTKITTTKKFSTFEYQEPKNSTLENLKEMWKNDPSSQFTIKCDNQDITAIKPIMCACSVVFKKMFETNMKEKAENRVEITDFALQIVQKMVEFCENETIEDTEECEEDLFKIAHKYEIESMKDFAITEMAQTITYENIASRLELAQLYELEDFEYWCQNFVSV